MTRFNRCTLFGFVLAALLSGQVNAGVVNGSFENFFNNWTQNGPNTATTGIAGVTPTHLNRMAFISNGSGSLPLAVHGFIVDTNLGLASGTFAGAVQSAFPNATEGATFFQSFALGNPGETCSITFDWNFLTNETTTVGQPGNNDFAFFGLVDGGGNIVASGSVDVVGSTFIGASSPFAAQTGWQSASITGLTGGQNFSLVFGVFDAGNSLIDSGLLVDNIQCQCVPEPSSAMLLGLATVSAVGFRRRRS